MSKSLISTFVFAAVALVPLSAVRAMVPTTVNGIYDMTTLTPITIGTCQGTGPGCAAVYGMDWLSDGRMVLLTTDFQGHNPRPRDPRPRSKVSIVSGLPEGPVTVEVIATHFKFPTGVVVVNDRIWVTDMDTVYRIPDNSPAFTGNAASDSILRMNNREHRFQAPTPDMYDGHLAPTNFAFPEGASGCWPNSFQNPSGCTNLTSHSHHYIFTPVYHQGKFYASYGGATAVGTGRANLNASSYFAGALLSWDSTTTQMDSLIHRAAGGFRSPNGNGIGPDGTIFVGDNEGSYLPMNTITRIKPFTDQFAGYRQDAGFSNNWSAEWYDRGAKVYEPPIAVNVYNNSTKTGWVALNQPYYLSQGPYAGDLIVGDANSRGLFRVALDTLNDTTGTMNVQGAVFYFTPGSTQQTNPPLGTGNNAMNRFLQGPDGTIYAGASRNVNNWPTGAASNMLYIFREKEEHDHFEIRRIRSLQDGFEFYLTQPVNPATVHVDSFTVGQRSWVRQSDYGMGVFPTNQPNTRNGTPQFVDRPISSVQVSEDSLRIRLVVPGILRINQGRRGDTVTHWHTQFTISPNVASASGAKMYTTAAAYAQNWISDRTWDGGTVTVNPGKNTRVSTLGNRVWLTGGTGMLRVHVDVAQAYQVVLSDPAGRVLERRHGSGGGSVEFRAPAASQGVYLVTVNTGNDSHVRRVVF